MSIATQARLGLVWLWLGVGIGVLCALSYAHNFSQVSQWLDYSGQEVVNATMQFAIYACLLFVSSWLLFNQERSYRTMILFLFTLIVLLSLTRELTEMMIFYSGIVQSQGSWTNAITGGFVGLTIGVSIGVLVYVAITRWSPSIGAVIQVFLLGLVAAGTAVQSLQLLMQVDWVSATQPIWNSNFLLAESSILGQMLYAVFGYEATPTLLEVVWYLGTLGLVAVATLLSFSRGNEQAKN
jgi:high-affinity iron transporter